MQTLTDNALEVNTLSYSYATGESELCDAIEDEFGSGECEICDPGTMKTYSVLVDESSYSADDSANTIFNGLFLFVTVVSVSLFSFLWN